MLVKSVSDRETLMDFPKQCLRTTAPNTQRPNTAIEMPAPIASQVSSASVFIVPSRFLNCKSFSTCLVMKEAIRWSLDASLFTQWSTLSINLFSLFQTLPPKDIILQTVLWIETFVQVVELAFYTWYAYHFHSVAEATFYRYHDWVITTPLMLLSTMIYYDYVNKPDEEVTLESFLKEHWYDVLIVFGFNMIMLVFGYLYEVKSIDLITSQVVGFAGFAGSFYVLWDKFVSKNPNNYWLYAFMFIVWGLYGVAAMFTSVWKNVSYNILDVFAKNFYGVFLSYIIYQKASNFAFIKSA